MCGDDHFSKLSVYNCPSCGELLYAADYPENAGKFECRTEDCEVDSLEIEFTRRKAR
jgi:hypothetical protein